MKDLNSFLSEEDKDNTKAGPAKDGEGSDDKRFILMMEEYKRLRRTDKDEANKLLAKALKLSRQGNVSKRAKLAAAYI
jgi:hypothetical protein